MVTNRKRPSDDEVRVEREEVLARIRLANLNLADRAVEAGMRFQLDVGGTLRVSIGEPPAHVYAQRIRGVRFDMDSASHAISGFVIDDFDDYLDQHPDAPAVLRELTPTLHRLGVIALPPQASRIEGLREGLQALLSA